MLIFPSAKEAFGKPSNPAKKLVAKVVASVLLAATLSAAAATGATVPQDTDFYASMLLNPSTQVDLPSWHRSHSSHWAHGSHGSHWSHRSHGSHYSRY